MRRGIFFAVGFMFVAISLAALAFSSPARGQVIDINAIAEGSKIINYFHKGGIIMYPILVSSIVALAIMLERLYFLRRSRIIPDKFLSEIRAYWHPDNREKALEVCDRYSVSISRILRTGLTRFDWGLIDVEKAIEGAGQHESSILGTNLRVLGAVANITPMLGLLGTVVGMIKAFNVIAEVGTGNPHLVASGISEALITTAAGLTVGIPTLVVYHVFRGRVEKFIFEMEEISIELMYQLLMKKATVD